MQVTSAPGVGLNDTCRPEIAQPAPEGTMVHPGAGAAVTEYVGPGARSSNARGGCAPVSENDEGESPVVVNPKAVGSPPGSVTTSMRSRASFVLIVEQVT